MDTVNAGAPTSDSHPHDLLHRIDAEGFYPRAITRAVQSSLAGESIQDFLVVTETTFDQALRRHMTVLVLTETRLLSLHADDEVDEDSRPVAQVAIEAVGISKIRSVSVVRTYGRPDRTDGGELASLKLRIAWSSDLSVEMIPADCPDPACDADHGYTGSVSAWDAMLRVVASVDGDVAVRDAERFAGRLSLAAA